MRSSHFRLESPMVHGQTAITGAAKTGFVNVAAINTLN